MLVSTYVNFKQIPQEHDLFKFTQGTCMEHMQCLRNVDLLTYYIWGEDDRFLLWEGAVESHLSLGTISLSFFHRYSNVMDFSFCCNSYSGKQITTNFCTCHDNIAIMACAKFCGNYLIRILNRAKQIFNFEGNIISERGPLSCNESLTLLSLSDMANMNLPE